MVPAISRRAIPPALYPEELTAAQARLRALRAWGWSFWLLMLPIAAVLSWILLGIVGTGLLVQMGGTALAVTALSIARLMWWASERPLRIEARQAVDRWRRLPGDQRWDAAIVLLERIYGLSGGDPALQDTARRMISVLFSLYEDIRALDRTLVADRILDGDGEMSERYYRLLAIRKRRESQIDALLNGLRDLHLEINEQLAEHVGPLQDRLQELMDRLEADREITRIAGVRRKTLVDNRNLTSR